MIQVKNPTGQPVYQRRWSHRLNGYVPVLINKLDGGLNKRRALEALLEIGARVLEFLKTMRLWGVNKEDKWLNDNLT